MIDRKQFLTHIAPPIAWAILIFTLSALPGSSPLLPKFLPENSDKVEHAIEYAFFAFLIFRARTGLSPRGRVLWALAAVAISAFYGATDEWHQIYVPQRECSVIDWMADLVGSVVGAMTGFMLHRAGRLR